MSLKTATPSNDMAEVQLLPMPVKRLAGMGQNVKLHPLSFFCH